MNINDSILTESKSARDSQLERMTLSDAVDIMSKAKALMKSLWQQGKTLATVQELAEYFEVSERAILFAQERHSDEFENDGVAILTGTDLKNFEDKNNMFSSSRSRLKVYPPRAAIRFGFVLRDSPVAKQVRTITLDLLTEIPNQSPSKSSFPRTYEDAVELIWQQKDQIHRLEVDLLKSQQPALPSFDPILQEIKQLQAQNASNLKLEELQLKLNNDRLTKVEIAKVNQQLKIKLESVRSKNALGIAQEFVDQHIEQCDRSIELDQDALIDAYKTFCANNGYHKMGLNTFVPRLKIILPDNRIERKPYYDSKTKTTGQIPAKWVGLNLI